jgi:DNA-directed RNA polymerase specialized sigma24 family protein
MGQQQLSLKADNMSISAKISPHLPYLRRFARSLSGSQEGGDAYVVELLESIIADPQSFPQDEDTRVALYRCFLKIWNSVNLSGSAHRRTDMITKNLASITPLPRQAFLLTAVEGFTTAQVASILEQPHAAVTELISKAGQEIGQLVSTDVLIIEDEPLIAMDLESLVENLGHHVVGVARTRGEAVASAQSKHPGLVLADIQLADGSSGIDAVNEILRSFNVPVIFITAFPGRLLTGLRPEPTFLIAKPFETNTVRAIISQALFFGMNAKLPDRQAAGTLRESA